MAIGKWLIIKQLHLIDKEVNLLWETYEKEPNERTLEIIREKMNKFSEMATSNPHVIETYQEFAKKKNLMSAIDNVRLPIPDIHEKAESAMSEMTRQLKVLERLHNRCIKHGAEKSAIEISEQLEDKRMEIEHEDHVYHMTFY